MLAACGNSGSNTSTTSTTPILLVAPALTDFGTRALTKDTATNIVFANTGGAPNADDATTVGCTASTNLPPGLTVGLSANKLSCAITGAPSTVNATAVTVTVTATNATGTDNATVSLTVADTPTPTLAAPVLANIGTRALTKDTATTLAFTNTGGAPNADDATTVGCTASTNLPPGLTVGLSANKLSCAITGAPTAVNATAVTVTITATNATGNDTATVVLTVAEAAATTDPILADGITATATVGIRLLPALSITNTGADIRSCHFINDSSAQVDTLNGLNISPTSTRACQITGTPDTIGSNTLTVRARSAAGMDETTVVITVTDATVPVLDMPTSLPHQPPHRHRYSNHHPCQHQL